MSNETLLTMASSNYRNALKMYSIQTDDERELNMVGYALQQAAELCIKHCMEINGIKYPHSHVIEDLLDVCPAGVVSYTPAFYNFAPAISRWEAKSRYIKNYLLLKKQIDTGFLLIRDFLLDNGVPAEELKLKQIATRSIDAFSK